MKISIISTLLLFIVLNSTHLFSQEEGFEFINPPITIVILGSSTAAGNGASPISNSWVNKYREYVQVFNPKNQVINLAKGGYNTYHLLPTDSELTRKRRGPDTLRNFTKALQFKPDGIIVNLPSNDIANGYSVAEQLANFRYYSKFCDSNDIELWITTTQARNFPRKRMRLLQRDVKDSLNSIFTNTSIDFWTGFCDQDFRLLEDIDSGDGCHLNNGGHKVLTDRVIESHAFRGELDKSGALRSIRIELQEEMPPYLLSVGFDGKIDKDSIYHTSPTKVKIVQDNRVLAVYLAENDFYQIEANVDVRLLVEIVFESNYCLTKVIECDFSQTLEFNDTKIGDVFYPLKTLDFEEFTLDLFNYRFTQDKMSIGRFYFDTNMMAMELDIDFTAKQTQRILDAFIEPPVKGNKRITYWENGKKQSVLKFKKGQLYGKCKWYQENQAKERIVKFKNGMYHGKYIDFNSEGKKSSLRIFEKDKQVGETKIIN